MLRIHSRLAFGSALLVALGLVASSGSLGACATSSKAFLDDEGGAGGEGGAGDEGGLGPEGGRVGDGGSGDGGDSGLGAPRIACGAAFCRSDETCVAGACNFACAGTHVPGDYATITSAVTAIAATGADATICLGAVQAGETVTISDPAAHMKKLTIIGTIPLQATLGSVSVGLGFSEVTLIGFGTSSTMSVVGTPKVTLRALKLSTPTSYALSLRGSSTTVPTTILVDACEVSGTTSSAYGIFVDNSLSAPLIVSIQNSYIHGGSYGVYSYGMGASLQLGILNNTIDKSVYGLYLSAAPTSQVGYVNNIISNSTQYGVFLAAGMTAVTHSNNALFGNTNNYSGAAVDGAGYVKTDCMLDVTSGVPEPKVGSPCRGTGKATGAPPSDFWNAPRGAAVDIGAVQPL